MALHHNPRIVTQGLEMFIDPADPNCYPGSGLSFTDLSTNGWATNIDYSSELSIAGSPAYISNTGSGGSYRFSNSPYINWATTGFTFSAWGYRDNLSDDRQGRMVDFVNAGNGHLRLTLKSTCNLNFRPTAGGSTDLLNGGTASAGVWHNLAITKEGNTSGGSATYSMYLDGILVDTNTSSALVTDSNFTVIRIMRSADDDQPTISWDGNFGPFMVYTRALAAAEVYQNYIAHKDRFK